MSYKSTHTGAQIDAGVAAALNPDATPSTSSTALITSGAVAAGLADKASNADVALKAPIASPALTGTPTAPTPTAGDDSNKIATTAFVGEEIATESAATEQKILALYPTDSISNQPVASFADGAEGIPVKALTVNITPVQAGSGDPSPVNQRPISGWTGAKIVVFGKNMYNIANEEAGYISDEGAISELAVGRHTNLIPVGVGKTFTFSTINSVSRYNLRLHGYDANGNWVSQLALDPLVNIDSWGVVTATIPSGISYVAASYHYACTQQMMEIGGTRTEYAVFTGLAASSIPFPTPPGTVYGGTLRDNGDGTWTLIKTYSIVNLSTLSWEVALGRWVHTGFSNAVAPPDNDTPANIICENYKTVAQSSVAQIAYSAGLSASKNLYINTGSTTAGDEPTGYMVYRLTTPAALITLTAESVRTLLGQNNIFADCGDVAALTYRADVGLYIEKKLAEA